ncbi:MAG: OmpA family protein [Myxococcota bacterium]
MSPIFLAALVGAASSAYADGYSTDIELLNPTFSTGSVPGVDSPLITDAGRWRVGMLTQYQQDPLVLYDSGYEVGAIVEDRVAMQFGATYAIARRAAILVRAPLFINEGTETPNLGADGAGFGDLSLAARFNLVDGRVFNLGVRGELIAPTGRKMAYMGDSSLRTGGALLASLDLGRVEVLTDAGGVARAQLETEEDITFGPEMIVNGALRAEALPDRLWVYGGGLTRGGFSNLYRPDSGENPVEAIAGLQLQVNHKTTLIDVGAGRGLADGYGTTQQRFFVGVTFQPAERPQPQPPLVTGPVPSPPDPDIDITRLIGDPSFEDGTGIGIEGTRIRLDEPIEFVYNTAQIKAESIPILVNVAGLLNENRQIAQIVVEGHASDEGSFEYNFRLSRDRANAVVDALMDAGVHPSRMAARAMGEVKPKALTDDETERARERRVEFIITQWYTHESDDLDPDTLDPRSGEAGQFIVPGTRTAAPVQQAPEPDEIDSGMFEPEDFEDDGREEGELSPEELELFKDQE